MQTSYMRIWSGKFEHIQIPHAHYVHFLSKTKRVAISKSLEMWTRETYMLPPIIHTARQQSIYICIECISKKWKREQRLPLIAYKNTKRFPIIQLNFSLRFIFSRSYCLRRREHFQVRATLPQRFDDCGLLDEQQQTASDKAHSQLTRLNSVLI